MTGKYVIEIQISGRWVRSWSFDGVYTMDDAQALLDNDNHKQFLYRITPLKPARKSYRRHATVTQLELRGGDCDADLRSPVCREDMRF
jgi:hypothetical protein